MEGSASGVAGLVDLTWHKEAVIYELHVRSFFDSNADGIGDFPGLIQKLDYLADLGVTALWLLPFYPSPGKDGGYDIADYFSIDSNYGTMKDWRNFLREAHRRGLRVITELVLNHTSDQHAWFQRSRRASKGSRWRDFYVWTDNPKRYKEARIIFKDFEVSNWTWDPVAGAYYWHRFYSHQPDLNFDSPEVHRAIFKVIDFWLDQGVDGFRLDAIPYLYERDGTSCENLPETHQFLKDIRRHVDRKYGGRLLLAEANQWPEEAVNYFGQAEGDECHMAFHFPLMPRLFMGLRMEDRVPIIDILEQTPPLPHAGQWALFLRNHDELTLEMVTDEERDYMYRMFAQDMKARLNLGIRRRLAPLLGNDRRKIELLNLLLLSMPGTPVLYYGDEIGMGDNIYLGDRYGVRTPMHWNSDKNAGFSRANPQALPLPVIVDPEYHFESINVEAQQRNANSLLWWTKRLLTLRKQWKAFGYGTVEFVSAANRKILAFIRKHEEESVLVVANLSRVPQPVELDLAKYQGRRPVELFGQTDFPLITSAPYVMTLAPHSAFWFNLKAPRQQPISIPDTAKSVELRVEEDWHELLASGLSAGFERALGRFLEAQSWFMGRGRRVERLRLQDAIWMPRTGEACLTLLSVEYLQGETEYYLVPLAIAWGVAAEELRKNRPESLICEVRKKNEEGVIYDGTSCNALQQELLVAIEKRRVLRGNVGECRTWQALRIPPIRERPDSGKRVIFNRSNSSLMLHENLFLKLFRKLDPGTNPEIEIEQHLAIKGFPNVPPLVGKFDYHSRLGGDVSLGVLSRVVPDSRNAWQFVQEVLGRFFDRVQTLAARENAALQIQQSYISALQTTMPATVAEMMGTFPEFARLLGQRISELHQVLIDPEIRDFAPEPFTPFYLRSLYQSMRNRVMEALDLAQNRSPDLPTEARGSLAKLLERKPEVFTRLQALYRLSPQGVRIRCHGSCHLGEVLHNGKDFFIIDFEGDASRPISERRIKRPPAYDLAKMIRSFDFAAHAALQARLESRVMSQERHVQALPWAGAWAYWAGVFFLKGYLSAIHPGHVMAQSPRDFELLLGCYMIDKAAVGLIRELRERPQLAALPMQGWLQTLDHWNV